ncbi:hypothetical protein [Kitasatospora sp. NPDC093806]|uniref:hypothetical protein n=1 Tax=Kitasatospora sp. NPDC093806 TaxID=3155075 RepID=UPI00342BCCC8
MGTQGPTFNISSDDLALDEEGKVSIANPELAQSVASILAFTPNPTHTSGTVNNCAGGNCAAGCGKPK